MSAEGEGKKNLISWCMLVSRRRAQGTPLERSFIRCFCQAYGIWRGLRVSMCLYLWARKKIDFSEPDPYYPFLCWIMPQTGQRRQSSVLTLKKIWVLLTPMPTSCFNPNLGFNPGIIYASQGSKILKSLQGGVEIISDRDLKFAQSKHLLHVYLKSSAEKSPRWRWVVFCIPPNIVEHQLGFIKTSG